MRKRLSAIGALITFAVASIGGSPAIATTSDDNGTSATSDTAAQDVIEPGTVTITDVSKPVLDVDEDLTITVAYTNNALEAATITEFDLFAQSTTAISETSVYYWMDEVSPARFVASVETNERVLPGHTINTTFTVPREDLPWATGEFTWGPRGIEVRVVTDLETVSDRTMIITVSDVPITPFPATAVVPVVDPDLTLISSANDLLWHKPLTDEDDRPDLVDELVDQWDHPGVTILADPSLEQKPRYAERLSLPMFDADIAALASAGRFAQAKELVDNAVFLPASAPSLTAVKFAADLGMDLLIPDAVFEPADSLTYTPGALTTIALPTETQAIATDSTISSAIAGTLIVGTFPGLTLDPIDARQVAVALSAVHHRQRPNDPRPLAVVVKRDATQSAREAALTLLETPWVKTTSLSKIAGGKRSPVTREFIETDAPLQGAISKVDLKHIDDGLAQFDRLATVFEDWSDLTDQARRNASKLLSVAWRSDPSTRNARIIGLAPTEEQMGAITFNTSSPINMISENSALPVQVTNKFTKPVAVVIHLDTPDIRLVAPDPVAVTLPASTTTTVSVPVEANGSGNLDVDVKVTNEAGDIVGSPDTLHVRVRADWENVGTAVIAAGVLAVFVIGLISSVREGRRSDPIEPDDFVAATKR